MKLLAWAMALAMPTLAVAAAAPADEGPPMWAFFTRGSVTPHADTGPQSLEGSPRTFTWAEIDNLRAPPDWFPDQHGPMPEIVAKGREPPVFACAACHLATGMGHPESSSLAGLSAAYMNQQMEDYRTGARRNPVPGQANTQETMATIGKLTTPEDAAAASAYFASLKAIPWMKVVETDTVPKTYVNSTFMRLVSPEGGTEPLGRRIVEVPQDEDGQLKRDPRSGSLAYVPPGSVAKGKDLVGAGSCALCHGGDLKGIGDVPHIAGRSPLYTVRQLYSYKNGSRNGPNAELMQPFVATLSNDQMLEMAAYIATLDP
jgi:cytochrome c553